MANERIVRYGLNYLEAKEIGQYFTVVFWGIYEYTIFNAVRGQRGLTYVWVKTRLFAECLENTRVTMLWLSTG